MVPAPDRKPRDLRSGVPGLPVRIAPWLRWFGVRWRVAMAGGPFVGQLNQNAPAIRRPVDKFSDNSVVTALTGASAHP